MATQSLKCDGRKKMEQSIPSVALTNCVAIATCATVAIPFFACYESTLAVHSENPLMVSNLTTGNSGQLKMSAKFRPSKKLRFWIWPVCACLSEYNGSRFSRWWQFNMRLASLSHWNTLKNISLKSLTLLICEIFSRMCKKINMFYWSEEHVIHFSSSICVTWISKLQRHQFSLKLSFYIDGGAGGGDGGGGSKL